VEIVLIKVYSEKPWRNRGTYQLIENCLKEKWRVHSINTNDPMSLFEFIRRLQWEKRKKLFVFNIAEFLDEDNKSCFLPSFLEDMNIPYLGASEKSAAIGFDKFEIKRLLIENGIPTPRYFVLENQRSKKSFDVKKIGFPLIVKPVWDGGQIRTREDSIVHDDIGLNKIIHRIFEEQNQPVLVEELVTGKEIREFSVGIIDTESRLFMPKEIIYKSIDFEEDNQSFGLSRKDIKRAVLINGGRIIDEITRLAELSFDSVGGKDYGRVNLRMNDSGWYVLDIDFMPGLASDSFLPKAANQIFGLEYKKLVQKLVLNSISRQK
jgi:D-alanine-D-alanine ligase